MQACCDCSWRPHDDPKRFRCCVSVRMEGLGCAWRNGDCRVVVAKDLLAATRLYARGVEERMARGVILMAMRGNISLREEVAAMMGRLCGRCRLLLDETTQPEGEGTGLSYMFLLRSQMAAWSNEGQGMLAMPGGCVC